MGLYNIIRTQRFVQWILSCKQGGLYTSVRNASSHFYKDYHRSSSVCKEYLNGIP